MLVPLSAVLVRALKLMASHSPKAERVTNRGKVVLHQSHAPHRKVVAKHKVTAIEVMIAASAVLVLVVLAVPPLGQWPARSEMRSAQEIVESSIVNARQTARIYQTEVVLRVHSPTDGTDTLTYTAVSPHSSEYALKFQDKTYQLPAKIRLISDREIIRFNAQGAVEPPVQLVLVSTAYESISERILLQ